MPVEKPLSEVKWANGAVNWRFLCARTAIHVSGLFGRQFFVAVSLKNPRFSRRWLIEVLRGAEDLGGSVVLTLVDAPYLSSLDFPSMSPEERRLRVSRLVKQHKEQLARLAVLVGEQSRRCRLVPWHEFQAMTRAGLKEELLFSYAAGGRVQELIDAQVHRTMKRTLGAAELQRLSRFFLEETPTLVEIYYRIMPGCIDVYPGPQADFFWELDTGLLRDELPLATLASQSGPPHMYAVVELGHRARALADANRV